MNDTKMTVARILGMLPTLIVSTGWLATAGWMPAAPATTEASSIPDFTQGGKKDESHDWTLGPTGAHGWVYGRNGHTAEARQILITAVDDGSPAAGILRANDVILGVEGKPFADDARQRFARAITAAEDKGGVLRLNRWREGQAANVEINLPLLGAYSDTAPYACPKSKVIFGGRSEFR